MRPGFQQPGARGQFGALVTALEPFIISAGLYAASQARNEELEEELRAREASINNNSVSVAHYKNDPDVRSACFFIHR